MQFPSKGDGCYMGEEFLERKGRNLGYWQQMRYVCAAVVYKILY
jgi:hypothetical protein